MSVLGLTWLLLCKFIEISDYEKAGMWKQCDGDSADDSGGIP